MHRIWVWGLLILPTLPESATLPVPNVSLASLNWYEYTFICSFSLRAKSFGCRQISLASGSTQSLCSLSIIFSSVAIPCLISFVVRRPTRPFFGSSLKNTPRRFLSAWRWCSASCPRFLSTYITIREFLQLLTIRSRRIWSATRSNCFCGSLQPLKISAPITRT